MNYNESIANAAREYVRACHDDKVERTAESRDLTTKAYNKLHWMVEAEKYGWNPDSYEVEW